MPFRLHNVSHTYTYIAHICVTTSSLFAKEVNLLIHIARICNRRKLRIFNTDSVCTSAVIMSFPMFNVILDQDVTCIVNTWILLITPNYVCSYSISFCYTKQKRRSYTRMWILIRNIFYVL